MAKYEKKIKMFTKIIPLYILILISIVFQSNEAFSRSFSDYNKWLKGELIPKLSKNLEIDFLKDIKKSIALNSEEFATLNETLSSIRSKDFLSPESYFNEKRLWNRTSYAKSFKRIHKTFLYEIEEKYQVPADILLAIWAVESDFGRAKLEFMTLKTITFQVYASHRKKYFYNELLALLNLLKKKKITYTELYGSSLGAMGQPQFMPSSYHRLGVDFDLDGKIDIWKNKKDVLASIANFLKINGWIKDLGWGYEVKTLSDFPCHLGGSDNIKKMSKWHEYGISKFTEETNHTFPINTTASLLYPKGEYGPKFLVTKNFFVLKKYNNSDFYALYVAHLSDRIGTQNKAFQATWEATLATNIDKVYELQRNLIENGFDVGFHDGLMGHKTRRSLGLWQEEKNREITCFPNN